VSQARHRMRRLEHLPGIERMKVRVIVAQTARRLEQHSLDGLRRLHRTVKLRQIAEPGAEGFKRFLQNGQAFCLEHALDRWDHRQGEFMRADKARMPSSARFLRPGKLE